MPAPAPTTTRFTPNGFTDYVGLSRTLVNVCGRAAHATTSTISRRSADLGLVPVRANPGSLCDSQPGQQLGCYNQGNEGSEYAGSRSRHPGGINSLFGDGSVHFIKNTINPMTWVQLGSINARRSHQLGPVLSRLRDSKLWRAVNMAAGT